MGKFNLVLDYDLLKLKLLLLLLLLLLNIQEIELVLCFFISQATLKPNIVLRCT